MRLDALIGLDFLVVFAVPILVGALALMDRANRHDRHRRRDKVEMLGRVIDIDSADEKQRYRLRRLRETEAVDREEFQREGQRRNGLEA